MNKEQYTGVVRETVDDIARRYPTYPPPEVFPFERAYGANASFNIRNQIKVDPWGIVGNPEITEADVRWLVAHEMGHWRQLHSGVDLWSKDDAMARTALEIRDSLGDDPKVLDREYRQLPLEADADRFASDYTGVGPEYDHLDFIRRVDEARKNMPWGWWVYDSW